jgi:hypothetical protein
MPRRQPELRHWTDWNSWGTSSVVVLVIDPPRQHTASTACGTCVPDKDAAQRLRTQETLEALFLPDGTSAARGYAQSGAAH